jgi:hypothetical protein
MTKASARGCMLRLAAAGSWRGSVGSNPISDPRIPGDLRLGLLWLEATFQSASVADRDRMRADGGRQPAPHHRCWPTTTAAPTGSCPGTAATTATATKARPGGGMKQTRESRPRKATVLPRHVGQRPHMDQRWLAPHLKETLNLGVSLAPSSAVNHDPCSERLTK